MGAPIIIKEINHVPETPEENLCLSAKSAAKYAQDLYDEFSVLGSIMEDRYPKEAVRLVELMRHLLTMTNITKNRAEKLIKYKSQ
ncbi:hypothetical protein [Xenorhabdus sp. Sc-CR9]|uniref:hypothetical protein n=1 Tax=Xenorhabdus sp. Sc-CR9 TaxID=2584468 RepID=UPI001F439141|nr:hypothetical protein [Xenorhabdus sp. Sc-CR9]